MLRLLRGSVQGRVDLEGLQATVHEGSGIESESESELG